MVQNNLVKFLVTKNQKEQILRNAERKGYNTVSKYIRDLALADDNFIEKINEIHRRVVENEA